MESDVCERSNVDLRRNHKLFINGADSPVEYTDKNFKRGGTQR